MITDFDDAYTNGAYIPNGSDWPGRWTASAEHFRENLPPGCTATGIPARLIHCRDGEIPRNFVAYGTPGDLPDPVQRALDAMRGQMQALAARVEELESELAKRDAAKAEAPAPGKTPESV